MGEGKAKSVRCSDEREAAAWSGNRVAKFFGGFQPFLDDDLYVGESFFVRLSIGGAARKFGDLRDKGFVRLAPIDDDLVFRHRPLPPSDKQL